MNKHAQEIISSIIEDFAVGGGSREELEAKSLFRFLNFCPPEPRSLKKSHGRNDQLNNAWRESIYPAIFRQDCAHASQTAAHSSMPPIILQSSAHSAQTSAHALQVCL
jgi:hypothetical protein